ncbi:hypothetical protein Pmani_002543 [Petrolisthes manimaculis]|uniref:RNA-directed DNA polymerase n=1 Tax=Petrolisthes manimaculis TaxID=1843537 RepID=A0AAE1QI45_9EUCA|nr:hypothetical protein Pmani_002543 [Petrolisthes manimaculis]
MIRKRKDENSEPVYFVFIEETFSILKRAHILTGHGGRDKTIKNLSQKYANITQESINLFKAGCIECQKKKRRPTTKGTVVRPILTKEFGTRSQVDLNDMQSMQGRFSWIMVYQDHLTKFIVLRPLTSKRAAEVAYQLLDIFLLFGAPQILQSDNGSEFTAQVIEELKLLWPSLIMVHGKPRHPQSQGAEVPASPGTPAAEYTNPVETAALDTATSLSDGPEEAGPLLLAVQDETSGSSSLTPAEVPASPDTPAISPLSLRHNQVIKERKREREAQELQAQKMVKRNRRLLTEANVGDNVTVPIPNVDRGRTDPKNLIGVIVERDSQELYKIATKSGVLDGKFSRNQFDICGYAMYSIEDVDMQKTLPLRKAVQEVSTCGAQHAAALGDFGYAFDVYELRLFVKSFLDTAQRNAPQFKDNMPGEEWARVPPQNIVNYDETNLTDDPKSKAMLFRKGIKHPERVMNTSKSSVSLMVACSAAGNQLPPYVVYKAERLMDTWVIGGPLMARYNRTHSGWFDAHCFSD